MKRIGIVALSGMVLSVCLLVTGGYAYDASQSLEKYVEDGVGGVRESVALSLQPGPEGEQAAADERISAYTEKLKSSRNGIVAQAERICEYTGGKCVLASGGRIECTISYPHSAYTDYVDPEVILNTYKYLADFEKDANRLLENKGPGAAGSYSGDIPLSEAGPAAELRDAVTELKAAVRKAGECADKRYDYEKRNSKAFKMEEKRKAVEREVRRRQQQKNGRWGNRSGTEIR